MKGVGTRAVAEGDRVLQMLRWLKRAPQSFMSADAQVDEASARLPEVPPDKVLRFDTKKMYAAIDARRAERNMTWGASGSGDRLQCLGIDPLGERRPYRVPCRDAAGEMVGSAGQPLHARI